MSNVSFTPTYDTTKGWPQKGASYIDGKHVIYTDQDAVNVTYNLEAISSAAPSSITASQDAAATLPVNSTPASNTHLIRVEVGRTYTLKAAWSDDYALTHEVEVKDIAEMDFRRSDYGRRYG